MSEVNKVEHTRTCFLYILKMTIVSPFADTQQFFSIQSAKKTYYYTAMHKNKDCILIKKKCKTQTGRVIINFYQRENSKSKCIYFSFWFALIIIELNIPIAFRTLNVIIINSLLCI
jgi:hypothetical protein